MTPELTVASFCYQGTRPIYGPWTSNNLQRMLRKHLTIPHRFVVITDRPDDPDFECETYPIWDPPPIRARSINCFVRLWLTTAAARELFGPRVVWIDQDVVIRANIDDLFELDVPLRCMRFGGRSYLSGGMVLCRPGEVHPNPWEACFDPKIVARSKNHTGSDQAILTELFFGRVPVWTEKHGIALNRDFDRPDWRIFFRTGAHKPWNSRNPERALYYAESEAPLRPDEAKYIESRNEIRKLIAAIEARYPLNLHHRRALRRLRQAFDHLGDAMAFDSPALIGVKERQHESFPSCKPEVATGSLALPATGSQVDA